MICLLHDDRQTRHANKRHRNGIQYEQSYERSYECSETAHRSDHRGRAPSPLVVGSEAGDRRGKLVAARLRGRDRAPAWDRHRPTLYMATPTPEAPAG